MINQLFQSGDCIDLTVTMDEQHPCWWPGNRPFHAEAVASYENEGSYNRYLQLEEHTGTHFDAPSHFIPSLSTGLPEANEYGQVTSELVPLQQFMGPAAIIDISDIQEPKGPGLSPLVTVPIIQNWENLNGELQRGDIVLFRTDWTQRFYVPFPEGNLYAESIIHGRTLPAWPAPDESAIAYLDSRGICTLGIDAPSMGALQQMAETHVAGLGRGMIYIESLINLHLLPVRGAYFIFLPIKCTLGSGAPGRAIALVPKPER